MLRQQIYSSIYCLQCQFFLKYGHTGKMQNILLFLPYYNMLFYFCNKNFKKSGK